MRDSIIYSSIRSFFSALFWVLGFALAILFVFVGKELVSESANPEVNLTTQFTPKIAPNAYGIREALPKDTPVILKLNIEGVIGTEFLSTETITRQLIESREGSLKGDRVKAILLKINTPGGTVVDSNGIYLAIKRYKEMYNVPVYAYVDGICASGGMYIACAADKVLASDVSLIGSVGVVTPPFFNYSQLLEKLGVKALTICAGACKDDLNPTRPWKENEGEAYKYIIDYYYDHFVNLVASHRPGLNKNNLNELGARVFPAAIAQEHGYVDESDYSEGMALLDLLKQAGIEDEKYQVITFESKNWLARLLASDETMSIFQGKIKHQIELTPELDARLRDQFLYLYRP